MGGDSDARRRLGVEAEAPATTAAPTTDQAIQAAIKAVRRAGNAAPDKIITVAEAIRIAVEAAAPILLADLEAVENERDHAQNVARAAREQIAAQEAMLADHGSGATTQHHWKRAALNKLRDLKALHDQHATLEAHTAELRGLLQRTLYYVGRWGSKRVELSDQIHAALADQPPQRGREVLARVERLEAFEQAIREAVKPGRWRDFNGPDGVTMDEVIADVGAALDALDQGEAQEVGGDE